MDPAAQPSSGPGAAVRHGTTVLGIDVASGATSTWSSATSSWTATSAAAVAGFAFATRGNTAWGWNGLTQTLVSFNGSTWSPQSWSGTAPTSQYSFALGAMPNGDLVVFGGLAGTAYVGSAWVLNASNVWSAPVTSGPSARQGSAMATDATGNLILFGGENGGSYFNDTWSFNGSAWTQLTPATSPPGRIVPGMAFHPISQTIVLVGGLGTTVLTDAWEFVGGNWSTTNISASYSTPSYGAITGGAAFDPVSLEVVSPVLGGTHHVVVSLSSFGTLGTGCVCDNQVFPFVAVVATGGSATLNGSFTIQLSNFNPGNALALAFDTIQAFPSTQWPLLPVGCPVFPFNWSTQFMLAGATNPIPVGSDAALIGQRWLFQGAQPPLFGFNGCSSNGIELRIGR